MGLRYNFVFITFENSLNANLVWDNIFLKADLRI